MTVIIITSFIRTSPAMPKTDEMTDVSMETLLRVSFTEFHNNPKFADDSKSAYLGEELSLHRAPLLSTQGDKSMHMRLSFVHEYNLLLYA
jgi:hypothetical protein